MSTLRLRVELDDVRPRIWREIRLPADLELPALHDVLQDVMGWEHAHLHGFRRGGRSGRAEIWQDSSEMFDFGLPGGPTVHEESTATVAQLLPRVGARATYDYDFGDSWEHTLTRLRDDGPATADSVQVVAGERACPPEDFGGVPGFHGLRQTLTLLARDPSADVDEWEREKVGLFFDEQAPEAVLDALDGFDVDATNARIAAAGAPVPPVIPELAEAQRRAEQVGSGLILRMTRLARLDLQVEPGPETIAEATGNLVWFLEYLGSEGLTLTKAGNLRAADLHPVVERLGTATPGPIARESQVREVTRLRESLRRLGLLRKAKGRLLLTRAGARLKADPVALWRHLRDRLPLGGDDFSTAAELVVMLDLAGQEVIDPATVDDLRTLSGRDLATHVAGPSHATDLRLGDAVTAMGWVYDDDGPVSGLDVQFEALDTLSVLVALGVLPVVGWHRIWQPTAHGRQFLRAVLCA